MRVGARLPKNGTEQTNTALIRLKAEARIRTQSQKGFEDMISASTKFLLDIVCTGRLGSSATPHGVHSAATTGNLSSPSLRWTRSLYSDPPCSLLGLGRSSPWLKNNLLIGI